MQNQLANAPAGVTPFEDLDANQAESEQLRVRVIALENLVISMLAQSPESQLVRVREMATFIAPRPGYTQHPLTLRAADEMRSLVDRAGQFRPK
ncbi:hypothetical protein B9Z51_17590 [Limnohabitans sp. T6-5]|uniref:hypothetical protein n=1 Tax=Limnohabitans sp. T6-5 TaxID=1100724 RepID=UPI000D3DBACB|nr:hypothetical protein [Limnohabitans sp. T6-5]PUE06052.1 hypothetical protein B9Z51_17590 [Limnohabitans sp. T6-5]